MCTATVTKSYLMKNGCISILATKLLNKIIYMAVFVL